MTTLHFDFSDSSFLKDVAKAAFPDYNGRKLKVQYSVKKIGTQSGEWSGGSVDFLAFVNLATLTVLDAPRTSAWKNDAGQVDIPVGFVAVVHSHFCGKDMGLTIYTPVEAPMLPSGDADELDEVDYKVLKATRGLKSSYAGISDYRLYELTHCYNPANNLTKKQVEASREKLIALGYMAKNKSITTKGKNALELHK